MDAYRLPKGSDDEKAARASVIQRALWRATEVPLDTLRACADALEYGPVVARCGNPTAASDVGVGVRLLEAAAGGAEANVRINLKGIRDEALKATRSATPRDSQRARQRAQPGAPRPSSSAGKAWRRNQPQ